MVGVVSLGTVPAGTTEAQVDDMILVIEVAGEDTPAPRSGLDRKWLKSKTLLYNIRVSSLSTHPTHHRPLPSGVSGAAARPPADTLGRRSSRTRPPAGDIIGLPNCYWAGQLLLLFRRHDRRPAAGPRSRPDTSTSWGLSVGGRG